MTHVSATQGVALLAHGLFIVCAIAGGVWFGPIGWPARTAQLMQWLEARV